MIRIGLTIYLMFATLAGPALCCYACCAARAMSAAPARPEKDERPRPAPAAHSCCHHRQAAESSHHAAPGKDPRNSQPAERHPCPCRQHGSRATALVDFGSDAVIKHFQLRHVHQGPMELLPAFPITVDSLLSGEDGMFDQDLILPFLSAQDILRAMHMLRC